MATIAELIIAARVDPAGIAQGLGEGTRILENYSQEAATVINAAIGSFDRLGRTIDLTNDAAVSGFRAQGDQLAANLSQLGATDAELNRIGTSIARVERAAGAAATQFAALHDEAMRMNREFDRANALAVSFQSGARNRSAGNILGALTGAGAGAGALSQMTQETQRLGTVSRSTLMGVSELTRGIANVARTGTLSALSMREFTGAAFRIGAVLGPWAEWIAIAGTAAFAIKELFFSARSEMDKTRKSWEDNLKQMMDSFDQLGLQTQLRQLEIGSPSAGVGQGGGYVGSMRDLQARINQAVDDMNTADRTMNFKMYTNAQRTYEELKPQWDTLKKQWDAIHHAILNPEVLPGMDRPITGLAATTVTVNTPIKQAAEDAKEAAKQLKAMNDEMAKLTKWLDQPNTQRFLPFQFLPGAQANPLLNTTVNIPSPVAAPLPPMNQIGDVHAMLLPVIQGFQDAAGLVGNAMMASFGPVALLFKVMEPAIQIISSLFDKLAAPLAAVLEITAVGLEPVFRLLYPIIRDVAIAMTYMQEIMDRVMSAIARLVGNVITAIGALIAHIPFLGGLGKSIENLGKSILNYSDGLKKSADEMVHVRDRLERADFGQTADSIAQLGDAAAATAEQLSNVPTGFKATLDYLTYLVQGAVGRGGVVSPNLAPAGGVNIYGDVNVDARTKPVSQVFDELKTEAQTRALSLSGNVARASEVWNH